MSLKPLQVRIMCCVNKECKGYKAASLVMTHCADEMMRILCLECFMVHSTFPKMPYIKMLRENLITESNMIAVEIVGSI